MDYITDVNLCFALLNEVWKLSLASMPLLQFY